MSIPCSLFQLQVFLSLWYTDSAVDSFQQEGGDHMTDMLTLIKAVVTGIVVHIICKWLDSK